MWRRVAEISLCGVLAAAVVGAAFGKEAEFRQKGVLADMQSLPCGYAEKSGPTLAGAIITGAEHKRSRELLCQEYIVKSDRVTYRIRPVEEKHPALLPVGEEADFRLKKDKMLLRIPELDKKEREYIVVSMTATAELAAEIEQMRRPPKPHKGKPLTIEPAPITASVPQPTTTERLAPVLTLAPEATAVLHVDSTPGGAQVFIDSSLAGQTPAAIKVQPGTHSIQVVMSGYADWVTRIEVSAGAQPRVTATLSR
jgi:PEGA domain